MREIKYRQAIFLDGKFRSWHYWGFIDGCFNGVSTDIDTSIAAAQANSCQYIGRKDRNNVEIYEGDIIRDDLGDSELVYEVKFGSIKIIGQQGWHDCPDMCGWVASNLVYGDMPLHVYSCSEIIGNIYSNPELMQGA